MTICQLIQYVRFLSDKEQRANAFTPEQLNLTLRAVNKEVFNFWLTRFQSENVVPEPLRKFLVTVSNGTVTSGVYTIPSNFRAIVSTEATVTIGGVLKKLELVSENESSALRVYPGRNAYERPFCSIHNGEILIYPTNAANLTWTYLKMPTTPVYDYYIDANYNEVCLASGATHLLTSGEVGSSGQTAGATVTGTTVELEWDDRIHEEFVNRMLEKLGVNLREPQVVQFSEMRKQEQFQTK